MFGPADPTCKATPVFTSPPVTVAGAGDYRSAAFTTSAVGTYRLVASYSGDANNAAVTTACADPKEAVDVGKATPTVATTAGPPILSGGTTADTATLSGGFHPTGTLTFKLYGPGDAACAGAAVATWIFNISGAGSVNTPPTTLSTAGTYRWAATYGGDAENVAVATGCNDPKEMVVVGSASAAACGSLGAQVDALLPGQSIASDLSNGLSFKLNAQLSIGLRVVLRAKNPANGSFVSLANFLVHASGAVTVQAADNGLGAHYARRALRFLTASEQAGASLEIFRIVHCRPDKQTVSAESLGVDSLRP